MGRGMLKKCRFKVEGKIDKRDIKACYWNNRTLELGKIYSVHCKLA